MNIVDAILFQCRYDPEAPAVCSPGVDLISYARLERAINNVVLHATKVGLSPGGSVALHVPDKPMLHITLMLGLTKLGIATASVGMRPLPQGIRFDAILSDGPHQFSQLPTIPVDLSWLEGDGKSAAPDSATRGTETCRIILTSGTTGEPKGVALSHDMILGRIMRYYCLFGGRLPSCARIFCDTTMSSSIGYTFFIYTLCKGGLFLMRGRDPEITLRALTMYQVDAMVAAPAGLAEFITYFERLRCQHVFNTILSTGSRLSKSLVDNVRARMGPLISGYGSTEAGQIATAPAHDISHIAGAVGYIAPGMFVEIVDESDCPCPAGQEGIVRIRGDYMASAYLGENDGSAQFFRDGWFYPGDIGTLGQQGVLIIGGRQKAILNLGGAKVKPENIEDVLAAFGDGLHAGVFLATNRLGADEIWAAVESSSPLDMQQLRQHCQSKLPPLFVPKRFIGVSKLPRNEMGKLDRERLLEIGKAN